jgi:uncharacterized protein YkwD
VSTFVRVNTGIRVRVPMVGEMFVSRRRRPMLALLLGVCALIALPAGAQAAGKPKRGGECANTRLQPTLDNLPAVRRAVLCLHNQERRAHGLPPLKQNSKLREAAEGHSGQMVAERFFAHDSPSAGSMVDRILRTGYAENGGWSLGENIAWGTGTLATAGQIHSAWMNSPGHRANILRRQFREIGIGIALGAPVDPAAQDGATYTADFGLRR